MNCIDSRRHVDKDVTVANCRINRLLFAYELVLRAWIFATGSSARIWSVLCCVRPGRNENQLYKRLRYYVLVQASVSWVDAQGCVSCKWAQMHCSWWRSSSTLGWYSKVTNVGTKGLIHGLVKQTQFCESFIAPWWRNRGFQTTQTFQFLNRSLFRSSSMIMNLRWRINGRDGIFAKSSRCDTSWQRAQVWHP